MKGNIKPLVHQRGAGLLWILTILVLIIVLVATIYWWTNRDDGSGHLNYAHAEIRDIQLLVTATGRLQPRDYVDVGAQVSGQLESLHVEVGDKVQRGDLLAEIDATLLEAQLDSSRAQLRNQLAIRKEREASLELARFNYERQQRLQVDRATAEELVQTAHAEVQKAEAQVESIEAQIEQTQSGLRADEANLNYTRIFAPMDGTIVSIPARRGQTLNATQTTPTILTIADLTEMTVEAQVSEADISRLKIGMPVYFTTMGNRQQRWESKLRLIEPTPEVENNVVLYNALFEVPNTDGVLMKEMTTQVFFVIDAAHDVVAVPSAAVQRDAEGPYVEVRREAGNIGKVRVDPGLTDRVHVEIKSGLEAGDEVVLPIRSAGAGAPAGSRGPRG
ncbi:efflux RND transporter periplasmic adaptor subunit [Aliidiomarina minuta]|uniref:Efflux RND transporter periplasmic adaptor subunit n=1 Tax=Aliidiomarina minuta TaxID=880057 RepID=A0A432WAT1_9GAMM|nr:efflux RND transporter periplasmic adaptor subunit [Aliidiomarina minuta]RUO26698.1 efflux RND transporter periplasmic adaptor subunit [Aliidiomarina minuta]